MVKYDWKKTLWKIVKNGCYVVLAGFAARYGQNDWYLVIAPVLVGFENLVKNW